jgi:predicted nucleic acid-binding protein
MFIINKLYAGSSFITPFVYAEILRGIQRRQNKLVRIRNALKEGWIQEIFFSSEEERKLFESLSVSLGFGEASGIAAAKTRGLAFACDDKAARREAALLDIKLTGTLGILKKAVNAKHLRLKEADRILKRMTPQGFYSPVGSL